MDLRKRILLCCRRGLIGLLVLFAVIFLYYVVSGGMSCPRQGEEKSPAVLLGELSGEYTGGTGSFERKEAVAFYKDIVVTTADVEYQRTFSSISGGGEVPTDRALIDEILKGEILAEEAVRSGLSVTEEEIDSFLDYCILEYYQTPEGRQFYDDYCTAAGISFEEYVSMFRERIPAILLKSKWKDETAKAYCAEHDLPYDEMNYPQEVRDAVDQALDEMFALHKGEIRYVDMEAE